METKSVDSKNNPIFKNLLLLFNASVNMKILRETVKQLDMNIALLMSSCIKYLSIMMEFMIKKY